MTKAETINYTEKELEAIAALQAHKGEHLTAKQLGVANVILTSLIRKSADERPMAEGVERVFVNKEDSEFVCPTCGKVESRKLYWID